MPTLTINGVEVTVAPGTNLIEAAAAASDNIPHYCYHSGLPVTGVCRMCQVEVGMPKQGPDGIEKDENGDPVIQMMPKLQIACDTKALDNMVVNTQCERVKTAQAATLEFLLVNHPLDCPVCDQAGECKLQNYYMQYGLLESRTHEPKNKKHKAVPVSDKIMLDSERCILCTRCVRFADFVTGTSEFGIINRGVHSEVVVDSEAAAKNRYALNTVDLCPVGALTDRDFRFKCRSWYLDSTDSVCPGCSRGCNIQIHTNSLVRKRSHKAAGQRVMRLKPRPNILVNTWWMCDEGRYGYKPIDENRILNPYIAGCESTWDEAIQATADAVAHSRQVAVWLSPDMTNEEIWLARCLFESGLNIEHIGWVPARKHGQGDDFLIQPDKHPNQQGLSALGVQAAPVKEHLEKFEAGTLKTLIVFGQDLESVLEAADFDCLRKIEYLIFIGPNTTSLFEFSGVVLASASYAEKRGTFTNCDRRVQRIRPAMLPLEEARPESAIIQDLARACGFIAEDLSMDALFNKITSCATAFGALDIHALDPDGAVLGADNQISLPEMTKEKVTV